MFFNVMFSFLRKRRTGYDITIAKWNYLGTISHGASNEPEAYLESSQTAMEYFCKNS